MAKGQTLQDPFLNALRRERVPVSIYLVNGIKLQGQIESFDQFCVIKKHGEPSFINGNINRYAARIRKTICLSKVFTTKVTLKNKQY